MSTNKRVFLIVATMLGMLSLFTTIYVSFTLKSFANKQAIERAGSIAESVRDALTAHMVNGTMSNRSLFLDNTSLHQDVENLRVLRSKKVIEQFGEGMIDEYKYDDIDKIVLKNGNIYHREFKDKNGEYFLRITIPYVATRKSNPNCLSCHTNAKKGDVLGVISMDVSLKESYDFLRFLNAKMVAISFVFLFITIFVANRYIKPYIKLFDDLEEGISKAYEGDFSYKVNTKLSNEAGKVATRLNDLSEIFRFKKTIELDSDKEKIYERLGYILNHNFHISSFAFMEINSSSKAREVVYECNASDFPDGVYQNQANSCRAFVTTNSVISTDFYKICDTCFIEGCEFVCLPFVISEEHSLVLHMRTNNKDEVDRIKEQIPIISNYIALAEPVLETKTLMYELKESTLKDGMTSLYNRRFLDDFVDNADTKKSQYSVIMIDIDYFKKVNDTYGHNIGDLVLISLAKILLSNISKDDYAVRYGGEEFLLILKDKTQKQTMDIILSIQKEFRSKIFSANSQNFNRTISVGYAFAPEDSESFVKAIKLADMALYSAKESGRDKIIKYEAEGKK